MDQGCANRQKSAAAKPGVCVGMVGMEHAFSRQDDERSQNNAKEQHPGNPKLDQNLEIVVVSMVDATDTVACRLKRRKDIGERTETCSERIHTDETPSRLPDEKAGKHCRIRRGHFPHPASGNSKGAAATQSQHHHKQHESKGDGVSRFRAPLRVHGEPEQETQQHCRGGNNSSPGSR